MNIVITGSTRGIGLGLAREFLARGHRVMVSSRHDDAVVRTAAELSDNCPDGLVFGYACDVTREEDVDALWNEAARVFPTVDIWINNAGRNNPKQRVHEMALTDVESTLRTNLTGTVYGSVVALRGMLKQGSGWIFNMEGFGSEGMIGINQVPLRVRPSRWVFCRRASSRRRWPCPPGKSAVIFSTRTGNSLTSSPITSRP